MITDTHAHLFWDSFKEDFDEVIKRAIDAKVTTVINVGTDLETSQEALDQIHGKLVNFPELSAYSSIGIHPHEALRYAQGKLLEADIKSLEEIYLKNPEKVVAVGECGLDFNFSNRDFIPSSLSIEEIMDSQRLLLKAQVNLAKKLNLPLLIHARDARHEIFDFIVGYFGILHCFSGDLEILKKALKTNFLISFSGTITYPKNDTLREVVKKTPLEKIVFETDCPFLPPQSKRGQRNEPSNIVEAIKLAADLKNLKFEEMAKISTENAGKIFAF